MFTDMESGSQGTAGSHATPGQFNIVQHTTFGGKYWNVELSFRDSLCALSFFLCRFCVLTIVVLCSVVWRPQCFVLAVSYGKHFCPLTNCILAFTNLCG